MKCSQCYTEDVNAEIPAVLKVANVFWIMCNACAFMLNNMEIDEEE